MKKADIYLRSNTYFIQCVSRLNTGMWIGTDPEISHNKGESGLHRKLLKILNASKTNIEPQEKVKFENLAEMAGLDSWKEFLRGVKYVLVTLDDNCKELACYPTIHRSLYHFNFDSSLKLSGNPQTDADLDNLLEEAFSRCR